MRKISKLLLVSLILIGTTMLIVFSLGAIEYNENIADYVVGTEELINKENESVAEHSVKEEVENHEEAWDVYLVELLERMGISNNFQILIEDLQGHDNGTLNQRQDSMLKFIEMIGARNEFMAYLDEGNDDIVDGGILHTTIVFHQLRHGTYAPPTLDFSVYIDGKLYSGNLAAKASVDEFVTEFGVVNWATIYQGKMQPAS